MGLNDTLVSRAAFRDALLERLADEFEGTYRAAIDLVDDVDVPEEGEPVSLEGRGLSGLHVVTRADVTRVLERIATERLGTPSQHHAELSTPATVFLAAICPRCDIPGNVMVSLHPELLVDEDGAELRVKAKTKAVVHVCGQMPLDQADAGEAPDGEQLPWEGAFADALPDAGALRDLLTVVLPAEQRPPLEAIEGWDAATRLEVRTWASAVHLVASDHDDVEIPPRPAALGEEGEVWTATHDHEDAVAYDLAGRPGEQITDGNGDELERGQPDLEAGGLDGDADLRPTGEVNPDALRGEADRATVPEDGPTRRRKR